MRTIWSFLAMSYFCSFMLYGEPYENALKQMISNNVPPTWALEQIQEDFNKILPSELTAEALDSVMKEGRFGDLMLVRYKVQNGQLKTIKSTGWARGSSRPDHIVLAITRILELCKKEGFYFPDCEFILTAHDSHCCGKQLKAPVLCFSKTRGAPRSILIPDSETLADGELLQNEVKAANKQYPWATKKEMAFWRGVTTGSFNAENYHKNPRFQLVAMSLRYPRLIDARFNALVQGAENFRHKITEYIGNYVPVYEHLHYKYQILIDGNTAAWRRAYWQLFGNSVIIKMHSDEIQWYYGALKPYIHYIPAATDSHDLVETIKWAKKNDELAKQISQNAQQFAEENLHYADQLYYIYLVLCQYGQMQNL